MSRVVIDTNIIISASLSKNSTPDKALNYAIDNSILLISEDTYNELQEKLLSSKFDKYVQLQTRKTFLKTLYSICEIVVIETSITACRDSKDNKFLEEDLFMNNPTMNYFPEQDIIHLIITNEEEVDSVELSSNITAELNANGELIGVEILKASTFLRDFILNR